MTLSPVTLAAFEKLRRLADSAWSREKEEVVSLGFTVARMPEYHNLGSREERERVHAELLNFERDGALRIIWDPRSGDRGQVERIQLIDAAPIMAALGERPLASKIEDAGRLLRPWQDMPPVKAALARWAARKKVAGYSCDEVIELVDALKVLDYLGAKPAQDVAIRVASAALFRDSKRIEMLGPALDYMTTSPDTPRRHSDEVFAALGLIRHPLPLLIAGAALLVDERGPRPCPRPYVGIHPSSIPSIALPVTCLYILTVENLTTFNELARGVAGALNGAVVYTGGMPSPSFLAAYKYLVNCAAPSCAILHWGDVDAGGFRIADVLAEAAHGCGRTLALWSMAVATPSSTDQAISDSEMRQISSICARRGWVQELAHIRAHPFTLEQEELPARLPA